MIIIIMKKNIIYFDNAATSWPKPPQTLTAMQDYLQNVGGSPGRSGHRLSLEAARIVFETREMLSQLFNVPDPLRIVLTRNATESLNIAIFGLLNPGDHVITSDMEHNSVMRPLRAAEARGVDITVVPCGSNGLIDPGDVVKAIRTNTKAIFITNASNVTGTIMPIADIGKIAREHDLVLCVDAAQTAGCYPIDVEAMHIDLLAFTGHKSLFGPSGTGGLYIREDLEGLIRPLMFGGTGSRSEHEAQPDFLPDRYESGTPNTIGIAGLGAGAGFVLAEGVDHIRRREEEITARFLAGAASFPEVKVFGPPGAKGRTAVVSFQIAGVSPSAAALTLDEEFGILCRPGLHCSPAAHRTIGTFPRGTIRFGFGYFNQDKEVDRALAAIQAIAGR